MHDRRDYGGGHNRDNRRGRGGGGSSYREHNFQKSFVGSQKRGREEDAHVPDPKNVVILKLMSLGDKVQVFVIISQAGGSQYDLKGATDMQHLKRFFMHMLACLFFFL
jgi:hypothetical protein